MHLTYTTQEEDLVFAISYLNLSITFVHGDDFSLKLPESEVYDVKPVLNALIDLCKCDPHDLELLNEYVVREILKLRKCGPARELKRLFNKKVSDKSDKSEKNKLETSSKVIVPEERHNDSSSDNVIREKASNIPLNNYLNGERLTMADLVLFAQVYKSIKEGTRYTVLEKNWFDALQNQLLHLMEFKKLEMIDFEMMDIRVGKIVEIRKHPKADTLYIEMVDIGQTKLKILSGLVGRIPMEELQDAYCLFCINLKKVKFVGEESHGMILCAESEDGFEVIKAPVQAPGEKLYLYGDKKPVIRTFNVPKLDVKKESFQSIFKHLVVKDHKLTFMDKTVLVGNQEVTVGLKDANVR